MIAAGVGLLPPAAGALVQEVIDVLAIGVALRAVLAPRSRAVVMPPADVALVQTTPRRALRRTPDHRPGPCRRRRDRVARDRPRACSGTAAPAADRDTAARAGRAGAALPGARASPRRRGPHRRSESQPRGDRAPGGRLARLLDELDGQTPDPEDLAELRGLLYGLHAILRLHNAQEEEGAFSLVHEPVTAQAVSS